MALTDTRTFARRDVQRLRAPFRTGADFSGYDHLKYIAISNQVFPVPAKGSVTFSSEISAQTPGTIPGPTIHGVYGPPFTWLDPFSPAPPGFAPHSAPLL